LLEANPNEHPVAASSGNSAASAVVDAVGRAPTNVSESLSAKIANLKLSLQKTEDEIKVAKVTSQKNETNASSNASNVSNASNASDNSSRTRFSKLSGKNAENK
jgi:hypothetical protein